MYLFTLPHFFVHRKAQALKVGKEGKASVFNYNMAFLGLSRKRVWGMNP